MLQFGQTTVLVDSIGLQITIRFGSCLGISSMAMNDVQSLCRFAVDWTWHLRQTQNAHFADTAIYYNFLSIGNLIKYTVARAFIMQLSWLSFALIVLMPLAADACDFCDRSVTFIEPLSRCYLDRIDSEINRLRASGRPVHLVNLTSCPGIPAKYRGGGLPNTILPQTLPKPVFPGPMPGPITLSFILTEPGLRCLAQSASEAQWASEDEVKIFEVTSDCSAD